MRISGARVMRELSLLAFSSTAWRGSWWPDCRVEGPGARSQETFRPRLRFGCVLPRVVAGGADERLRSPRCGDLSRGLLSSVGRQGGDLFLPPLRLRGLSAPSLCERWLLALLFLACFPCVAAALPPWRLRLRGLGLRVFSLRCLLRLSLRDLGSAFGFSAAALALPPLRLRGWGSSFCFGVRLHH